MNAGANPRHIPYSTWPIACAPIIIGTRLAMVGFAHGRTRYIIATITRRPYPVRHKAAAAADETCGPMIAANITPRTADVIR